jgi:hypothetical protein
MRSLTAPAFTLLLVCSVLSFGQEPRATASGDVDQVRNQLSDTLRLLQQTRQELKDSQEQIKALRAEVDSIKASLAQPGAGEAAASDVEAVKEAQALDETQVEQIYQTKVESGSKYRVKLSGLILFNAGMNRGSVDNQDVPMLALRTLPGQVGGDVNATMRQTMFNIGVTGPNWLGARTSADVQFDFFGGFPETLDGNVLGVMRLRTGRAQLDWESGSVMVGQDQPFISPLSPTSLATIGTPALGYSGNLWTWTPQIVGTKRLSWSENTASTIQLGILDPLSGEPPQDEFERLPESGERSRVPAVAARHALSFKVAGRTFGFGTSGLYSRKNYGFGRTVNGYAATVDWMMPLAERLEISGEFFRGRAIGGLWGAIGTSAALNGPTTIAATRVVPVNTIGGWTQVKYKLADKWEINSAFGIDNPFARDLLNYSPASGAYRPVMRNSTEMLNIINRPKSNLVLSLEYRHLNTVSYGSHRYTAENVNLGIGVHF